MIVRADVNVFDCPERDQLECVAQNDLGDLVNLHHRAQSQVSSQHQSQKKGKSNKKNHGSSNKKSGSHNQQHRGSNNKNHAQQQSQPSSSTPVDQLTHHVSHTLNGTHSASAKRVVLNDLTETRNTGNAIVHDAASLESVSVHEAYDIIREIPQPGLPYVKRDKSAGEVAVEDKEKRTLFIRPWSVAGTDVNSK